MKTLFLAVIYVLTFKAIISSCAKDINVVSSLAAKAPEIAHGYRAYRGQFPYHVALLYEGYYQCGGALISDSWALTAAHCTHEENDKGFSVELGAQTLNVNEEGRLILNVSLVIPHPKWQYGSTLHDDIALLKLTHSVQYTEYIKPVSLPSLSSINDLFEELEVQVSGWGLVSSNSSVRSEDLNYVNLTIITNEECAATYNFGGYVFVINSTICTSGSRGTGPCTFDSGSPLVINLNDSTFIQIGIVSFGNGICGSETPSAYTRVTSYLDWISEVSEIIIQQ